MSTRMERPFELRADGGVEAALGEVEADVLARVAADLAEALGAPDEAMRRLYPPAYPDDEALEEEFRRLTHDDLDRFKLEAARAVLSSIDRGKRRKGEWHGTLDADEARAWLSVLNDARLTIGTRLDVTEDMDHTPRGPDDPDASSFNLYLFLSSVQAALIEELLEGLPG